MHREASHSSEWFREVVMEEVPPEMLIKAWKSIDQRKKKEEERFR